MIHPITFQQQFSSLFAEMNHVAVAVDHYFVSLLLFDVTLNDHSRDSANPRLLNFYPSFAEMNVDVFAHVISIFHHFLSDVSVQLMVVVQLMVMGDSNPRVLHLIHHQVLE